MNINGKTAIVTGGAHRVGRAITLELARAGANVVINFHSSAEKAKNTADEATSHGVGALTVQADIANEDQIIQMVAAAHQEFGSVDILVNSADPFDPTPFPTNDSSAWHRKINTAIHGAFYCANAAAPLMLDRGEGVIINIVDLSVWKPSRGFAAHSVAKAGLMAFTRQLALDLAPTIRANAIAPGPVLPPPDYDEATIERIGNRTLLKRWGKAEDVSQAARFLIEADYITGEVIVVDGGERYAP
jgi:NAD(P)-dependent dehydrogenase (short-subunit alcohol dehydrogenase family)